MSHWRDTPLIRPGLALLDAGAARAAHEAFEDVWRASRGSNLGELARALSQWAAACVHLESGREAGFKSLAAKSAARLSAAPVVAELGTSALAAWITDLVRDPRVGSLRPTGG